MCAMFFGMPLAVFPALATGLGGPAVVGLLYAAPAAGAVIASVDERLVGARAPPRPRGRARRARLGRRRSPASAPGTLWLGARRSWRSPGRLDEISGLFRGVIWNETTPTRCAAASRAWRMLSWASGPTLGTAEAGSAASLVGLRASVVAGGVLCVGRRVGDRRVRCRPSGATTRGRSWRHHRALRV